MKARWKHAWQFRCLELPLLETGHFAPPPLDGFALIKPVYFCCKRCVSQPQRLR